VVSGTVPANSPASVSVGATLSGGGDVSSANNSDTPNLSVAPGPDLQVAVSNSPNPLLAGTTGSLSLTVANVGQGAHSGLVTASLAFPAGWTELTLTAPGWSCSPNPPVAGSNLVCTRTDSLLGGSAFPPITVTGTVPKNTSSPLTVNASVTGNGDVNAANNSTSASIAVNKNRSLGAFSCVGNAGVPPIVRAEGLAELVGDLVLNCTGGTPTAAGQPVPQANVQIFLNTNITSRLTNDPWSEALLMIDEPHPSSQHYCSQTGGCSVNGVGDNIVGSDGIADGVDYDAVSGTVPNMFQGRQSGANSIVWLGVPIDPPGELGTRIIRITNVRANANQLGTSSTLIPTQIVMFVSVTGSTSVPINNPQQTVAFIQPGLSFSVRKAVSNYLQCVSFNKDTATDSSKALSGGLGTTVRFSEGFASSFKKRVVNGTVDQDTVVAALISNNYQNVPGAIYNTESGFYNGAAPSTNGLNSAGLADHGTRLMARFANVPAGVALYASVYPVISCSDCSTAPGQTGKAAITIVPASSNPSTPSIVARLVTTNANGGGDFSKIAATTAFSYGAGLGSSAAASAAPISLSNGSGMAVWEVLNSDPLQAETFEFGIGVSYLSNTSSNLPGLGSVTVAGSLTPLSTATSAATSAAPIPRFADSSLASSIFSVNPCTTNLLFVFLSNQVGFDSGVVISNTSVDPYGTAAQAGPCKLNYYGETTGGGAAPAAQTSATIPSGKQLTAVLSTGGNYGIAATPSFQGYMIAQCQFQYAHGMAYVSDVGANRVTEAYQALVLDSSAGSRTLYSSEVLGH
jgi:hypothetical protein